MQDDNHFQQVIDRFEDDVLSLAYYTKDRDVICGEYKSVQCTFVVLIDPLCS